jgi:hypothetical protein
MIGKLKSMKQEQVKKTYKLFAVILKPYVSQQFRFFKKFSGKCNGDNKKDIHKENKTSLHLKVTCKHAVSAAFYQCCLLGTATKRSITQRFCHLT